MSWLAAISSNDDFRQAREAALRCLRYPRPTTAEIARAAAGLASVVSRHGQEPEALLRAMGFEIAEIELGAARGAQRAGLARVGARIRVEVDSAPGPTERWQTAVLGEARLLIALRRKRLAHELGHVLLRLLRPESPVSTTANARAEERLCDAFAVALLTQDTAPCINERLLVAWAIAHRVDLGIAAEAMAGGLGVGLALGLIAADHHSWVLHYGVDLTPRQWSELVREVGSEPERLTADTPFETAFIAVPRGTAVELEVLSTRNTPAA